MWLMKYQQMEQKTFIPFSEFYKKSTIPTQISQKSSEEILNEANEIRKQLKK